MEDFNEAIVNYNLCRTCLAEDAFLHPIFVVEMLFEERISLSEILKSCARISIEQEDGYPNAICLQCKEAMKKAYEFRKLCEKSDYILRSNPSLLEKAKIVNNSNLIGDGNIKIEPPDISDDLSQSEQQEDLFQNELEPIKIEIEENNLEIEQCFKNSGDFDDEKREDEETKDETKGNSTKVDRTCEICNKSFYYPSDMIKHRTTHMNQKPYRCQFCGKGFAYKQNLKIHTFQHTGGKDLKCNLCNKSFWHISRLKSHMATHVVDQIHICKICGESCNTLVKIMEHFEKHSEENCSNEYKKKGETSKDWEQELKTFEEDKLNYHKCRYCPKQFPYLSRLYRHEIVHFTVSASEHSYKQKSAKKTDTSKYKSYQCTECNRLFQYYHTLEMHERKHLAERKRKCFECGVTYQSPKALETHVCIIPKNKKKNDDPNNAKLEDPIEITKSKIAKPYLCTICGKKFSQPDYLKIHLFQHTGEKPFKCDVCGATFLSPNKFGEHKKTHEPNYKSNDLSTLVVVEPKLLEADKIE